MVLRLFHQEVQKKRMGQQQHKPMVRGAQQHRTGKGITCLLVVWLGCVGVPCYGQSSETPQRRLRLSLKQAVELALAPTGHARVQLAEQLIRHSQSRVAQSRAALLPMVDASVSEQNLTRNLEAFGIRFQLPVAGFRLPTLAGPFSVFDARATLHQSLFDLSAIRRFQAAQTTLSSAQAESEQVSDEVAGLTAESYLAALRAEANREQAESNVTLAEALLNLAVSQKAAGTGTGIEVTRAGVQLANERQRLLEAQQEVRRAHLRLASLIGVEFGVMLELSDTLDFAPLEPLSVDEAIRVALQTRADLKAQRWREQSARLNYQATRAERFPSVVGFADYGSIGLGPGRAIPTRSYGLSVRIPIFDGGRRDARRAESLSLWQQETIQTDDLRRQIELDVRLSLDRLQSAQEQVHVAEQGLVLAENELAQARRRYEAGVTTSLELTDAQTRLIRAKDNHLAAVFNYHLATIGVARAIGVVRQIIR